MATFSTLVVINNALVLCGASTVSSLTEDTPNARALNIVFDLSAKSVLIECKWNFSTTRSTLATVATTTIPWFHSEEGYVYARPTDALRIFELSDPCSIWREEGDYIIADSAGLGAKYVWYVTDVSKYPAYFMNALVDKLCSDICFIILNSLPKAESFLTKYKKVSLPNAMAQNSQTGTQQQPQDDAWLNTKWNGGGNQARSYS